jgi:hypothetical protein
MRAHCRTIHAMGPCRSRFIGDPATAGQASLAHWMIPHHRFVGFSPMNRLPQKSERAPLLAKGRPLPHSDNDQLVQLAFSETPEKAA